MSSDMKRLKQIAERVTKHLFTDGSKGQVAERLVLTLADGHHLGGWMISAMQNRILKALSEAARGPTKAEIAEELLTSADLTQDAAIAIDKVVEMIKVLEKTNRDPERK